MRMRRKPWAEAELENSPVVVRDFIEHRGGWGRAFGNDNKIELEIGTGKGRFIKEKALKNPEINFIGIEKQLSVCAVAAREIGGIKNIRLLHGDSKGLEEMFAEGECSAIYINFCDPWPKDKWAKRRLTNRAFLKRYRRILDSEGRIEFKTDNRDLFAYSLNEFLEEGFCLRDVSLNLHGDMARDRYLDNIMTEYEEKWSERGSDINRLVAYVGYKQI